MGKKNNVNPDHYKEAGRERPGQDINQEINKQKFAKAKTEQRLQNKNDNSELSRGGVDGIAPVKTATPVKDLVKDSGQTAESANSSNRR